MPNKICSKLESTLSSILLLKLARHDLAEGNIQKSETWNNQPSILLFLKIKHSDKFIKSHQRSLNNKLYAQRAFKLISPIWCPNPNPENSLRKILASDFKIQKTEMIIFKLGKSFSGPVGPHFPNLDPQTISSDSDLAP
jgi:hypothetical protein